MVQGLLSVELGMNRHADFKWQSVSSCQSIPKNYSGNESTLDTFSVLDGDVTAVNDGLLVHIAP